MFRSLHIPLRGYVIKTLVLRIHVKCHTHIMYDTLLCQNMLVSGELVHITSVVCNVHYLATILGSTAMAEPF